MSNNSPSVVVRKYLLQHLGTYLAGWNVTIVEQAADVNGDGEITLTDSALIRRYLAGWDVTFGKIK